MLFIRAWVRIVYRNMGTLPVAKEKMSPSSSNHLFIAFVSSERHGPLPSLSQNVEWAQSWAGLRVEWPCHSGKKAFSPTLPLLRMQFFHPFFPDVPKPWREEETAVPLVFSSQQFSALGQLWVSEVTKCKISLPGGSWGQHWSVSKQSWLEGGLTDTSLSGQQQQLSR